MLFLHDSHPGSEAVRRQGNLAFTGEGTPIAESVETGRLNSLGEFCVSASGVLVYAEGGLHNVLLTWLDRTGRRLGTVGEAGDLTGVQFSPNRKMVATAFRADSHGITDIWLYDVLRGLRTRFTFDRAKHWDPVWSPDGRTIVFRSDKTGQVDLYRKLADSSRNEELLYDDDLTKVARSFSPDGWYLAYITVNDPRTRSDIWILPDPLGTTGAAKPWPFMQTEFNEENAQFSPDGHWIAYQSNESGRYEVYIAPFPGPGGKRQVSTAGGGEPRWRSDGKELFYVTADSHMMAAEVDLKGSAPEIAKAATLFEGILTFSGSTPANYDVSADGQRFLAALAPEGETGAPLTVVQNWTAALKK